MSIDDVESINDVRTLGRCDLRAKMVAARERQQLPASLHATDDRHLRNQRHKRVAGIEGEQRGLAAHDSAHVLPHVREVQLLLHHRQLCVEGCDLLP